MNLKTRFKKLEDNIRFTSSKISNAVENRRLNNYCDIINRIYADYQKDKTHMSKILRTTSPQTRTRLTHQEAVANITKILAKALNLNVSLAETIASNHDIGHTFYGHDGGWWISEIEKDEGTGYLSHNAQGPRMLIYGQNIHDKIMQEIKHFHPTLSERKLDKIRKNLWKVDDGIWCHNGETSEKEFRPNLNKTESDFIGELKSGYVIEGFENNNTISASTIEGCLIRPADIISYFCRDIVDGLREGLLSELNQEYISALNKFGVSNREINAYLVKQDFETLSRRIENVVIKAVIDNSDKNCIRIPESVSISVKKMRTLNNENIVNKVTRPTEATVFPSAIRELRNIYKDILLDNNLLERLRTANTDLSINQELAQKYEQSEFSEDYPRLVTELSQGKSSHDKITPHMQFLEWICRISPEHYQFLENVVDDCIIHTARQETMEAIEFLRNSTTPEENGRFRMRNARVLNAMKHFEQNEITDSNIETYISSVVEKIYSGGDINYLSKENRMAKKLATFFIGELNDVEFIRILVDNGLITRDQLEDLHQKFVDIDFDNDDGLSITDAWRKIAAKQGSILQGSHPTEEIEY